MKKLNIRRDKKFRTGRKADQNLLVLLWEESHEPNQEGKDGELDFSQIIEKANLRLGLSKRTTINYLNYLIKINFLEKRVTQERKTFYSLKNNVAFNREKMKQLIYSIEDKTLSYYLMHFLDNFDKLRNMERYAFSSPEEIWHDVSKLALEKTNRQLKKTDFYKNKEKILVRKK